MGAFFILTLKPVHVGIDKAIQVTSLWVRCCLLVQSAKAHILAPVADIWTSLLSIWRGFTSSSEGAMRLRWRS